MASTLRITQRRSENGANPTQRAALRSLGLGKVGRTVERPDHPTLRGAIDRVRHLVEVEEG
jgi:large subunit ribosomal protein L30